MVSDGDDNVDIYINNGKSSPLGYVVVGDGDHWGAQIPPHGL